MIKKIAIFILFFFCHIGLSYATEAQDVIQKIAITNPNANFGDTLNQVIETAKYFDEKYPEDKINEDMTEDIKTFFPNMSPQQVINFQYNIRDLLSIYRHTKKAYEKYKEELLTPKEPPLIVDDDEYFEYNTQPDYVSNDDIVVISDIKTVVPYSGNMRDIESYNAKIIRDANSANRKGDFDELKYIAARVKFKEILFYDILYPSPLTGKKGIGPWFRKNKISSRLITSQTGIKDSPKVQGIIDIKIPTDTLIIANDGLYHKPQISFTNSQNLKNWNLSLPIPIRLSDEQHNDWSVYVRELPIPVTFEAEDSEKPLDLNADITLDVCDADLHCQTENITSHLTLQPEYSRHSSVDTFITQRHLSLPTEHNRYLQIESIKIRNLPNVGDFVEVRLIAKKDISSFTIFIDSPDNIAFEAPRTYIDNRRIISRFLPLTANTDLQNEIVEITATLNNKYSIRNSSLLQMDNTIKDDNQPLLTLKFILLALISGIFLNLTPFVFPFFSLKILSLTKFGARNQQNLKDNAKYTLNGIFITTFLLAGIIIFSISSGHAWGWGVQFQSMTILITAIFILLLLLFSINNGIVFNFSDRFQKLINTTSFKRLKYFLSGVLIVLMSSISTSPYFGSAIGYALTGTASDIFLTLSAVALGLSLPYMLLYLLPILIFFIPTPDDWMKSLKKYTNLMLVIAIIWLLVTIKVQTATWPIVRLTIYLLFISFLLTTHSISQKTVYDDLTPSDRIMARRLFATICLGLVFVLYIVSIFDISRAYNHRVNLLPSSDINIDEINQLLQKGQSTLINVNAAWCFKCKYNNTLFHSQSFEEYLKQYNTTLVSVNSAHNYQKTLNFMKKYHRSNLPFNILFTPLAPDGVILPDISDEYKVKNLISNFAFNQPES